MRRWLVFLCPVLVFIVLICRYVSYAGIYYSPTALLLPVSVLKTGENAFSSFISLRYYNFIPVRNLSDEKGTIVINRSNDGRVRFVSVQSDRPLRPKELLLKYVIVPSLSLDRQKKETNIRFSSDFFRFLKTENFRPSSVRYAVVHVDNAGNTVLKGLADGNGVLLVKDLKSTLFGNYQN